MHVNEVLLLLLLLLQLLLLLHPFIGLFSRTTWIRRYQKGTKSSAIAEGPRDASCQLKSCQLPRNSVETSCTTSPDHIDVTKLEVQLEAMCNKHLHLAMMRPSRFSLSYRCHKQTDHGRAVDITCIPMAKFSKSTM